MMRESIGKFRGKSLKTGEWLFGSLINNLWHKSKDGTPVCYILDITEDYDCWEDIADLAEDYEVDPETVGELYTIVKNGTEFYEGDIISSRERPENKHIIRYCEEEARFDCEIYGSKHFRQFTGLRKQWLEEFDKIVIGTIHDKGNS